MLVEIKIRDMDAEVLKVQQFQLQKEGYWIVVNKDISMFIPFHNLLYIKFIKEVDDGQLLSETEEPGNGQDT